LKYDFENFYNFLKKSNNFIGCNITIPYKEDAFRFSDTVVGDAKKIGSVNTLKLEGNKIFGYNTDVDGFLFTLKNNLHFSAEGKNITILGSGATCKTVVHALNKEATGITIVSRNKKNIEHLISEKIKWKKFNNNLECLTFFNTDLIINTTPLGIKGETIDINWDILKDNVAIFDLIYFDTPLIIEAKNRNITCSNGKNMLIYQAIKSFEIWTQVKVPDFFIDNIKNEVFNAKK
jgi:shikimate dehydrogenase